MENNSDIIDFFHTLVSDEYDTTAEYNLLRQADTLIRRSRPWEILKKLDSSQTRSSGENFSNSKTLPTDFDRPNKLFIGEQQLPPLKRVRLEDSHMLQDVSRIYRIDYRAGTFAISNGTQSGVIYHNYIYKPARLTSDGANSTLTAPVFPDDFYAIYAYKMAEIAMGGIDEDDRSVAAVPQWVRSYRELWDVMISWDADLKDEGDVFRVEGDAPIPPLDPGLL